MALPTLLAMPFLHTLGKTPKKLFTGYLQASHVECVPHHAPFDVHLQLGIGVQAVQRERVQQTFCIQLWKGEWCAILVMAKYLCPLTKIEQLLVG